VEVSVQSQRVTAKWIESIELAIGNATFRLGE
jgi:hypothetical protein